MFSKLRAFRKPTVSEGVDRFAVADGAEEFRDHIYYPMAGKKRKAHGSWYRGSATNFHPVSESLREPDAFEKYVGKGWLPRVPFISRNTFITAFGSCFAAEVTKYLLDKGYRVFGGNLSLNSHIVRAGDGIVNTAALRQQFEWALDGAVPSSSTWHDSEGALLEASEDVQRETREIILRTEVFVLTLGLSELWYDKLTGEPFWRAIPLASFDDSRHGFRILGAEENRANLARVHQLIRAHRPDASIILTLSPIPLAATFRPVSCITANSVSKASLRVALDELMRDNADDTRLFYFPSYELVTAVIPNALEHDLRHPTRETINTVMAAFGRAYLA